MPIVLKSGRRALLTMEKGASGEKTFNDAIDAWQRLADAAVETDPD